MLEAEADFARGELDNDRSPGRLAAPQEIVVDAGGSMVVGVRVVGLGEVESLIVGVEAGAMETEGELSRAARWRLSQGAVVQVVLRALTVAGCAENSGSVVGAELGANVGINHKRHWQNSFLRLIKNEGC